MRAKVTDSVALGDRSDPILRRQHPVSRFQITNRRLLVSSLVINWLVGRAVMFALAWIFLPDLPEFRTGLIIVGLARCIAMVIIWNDLACGDREAAAVLVALNSVFQVLAFGLLGWFYLNILPGWLGQAQSDLDVSAWSIFINVLIFLGIPLAAGFLTRRLGLTQGIAISCESVAV